MLHDTEHRVGFTITVLPDHGDALLRRQVPARQEAVLVQPETPGSNAAFHQAIGAYEKAAHQKLTIEDLSLS
ncbi:MAG: hypothetical protein ACRDVP_07335 [Acidimicrobiales bacterium]